jgi:hypothetical protein
MKYLSNETEIVFVGLNPTEQALKHNSVFCQTATFWNILEQSGIYPNMSTIKKHDDLAGGRYKDFAQIVFCGKLGFKDLVEDVFEKKANKVRVQKHHVEQLIRDIDSTSIKKLVLLGKGVFDSFQKHVNIANSDSSKIEYGRVGVITLSSEGGKRDVEVFCMPFPETSPIPNKANYYKQIISEL